nr:MAG TPA: hypothetical protein [Caudoviricetes sp.]
MKFKNQQKGELKWQNIMLVVVLLAYTLAH